MTLAADTIFRLKRPATPLPTEADFDPAPSGLDAQTAWQNFGNLSLQQAYGLFLTDPARYQEDFMFMGSRAFAYYLPVLDHYLRTVSGEDENDDCAAAIIGSAVSCQLQWHDSCLSDQVVHEIIELSIFVRAHLSRYSPSPLAQSAINHTWEAFFAEATRGRGQAPAAILRKIIFTATWTVGTFVGCALLLVYGTAFLFGSHAALGFEIVETEHYRQWILVRYVVVPGIFSFAILIFSMFGLLPGTRRTRSGM